MCFEINTIQEDLNSAFCDSIQLRKNIIKICRNHFAFTNNLNNTSISVSDLINSLHTSVMNYEAIQKQYDSMQLLIHLYDDDTVQVSILYVKFTVEWVRTIDQAIYWVIYI
jgi:hypothetical protein